MRMAWACELNILDGVRSIHLLLRVPSRSSLRLFGVLVEMSRSMRQHIATITDLDEKIAAQCIASRAARADREPNWSSIWWRKRDRLN